MDDGCRHSNGEHYLPHCRQEHSPANVGTCFRGIFSGDLRCSLRGGVHSATSMLQRNNRGVWRAGPLLPVCDIGCIGCCVPAVLAVATNGAHIWKLPAFARSLLGGAPKLSADGCANHVFQMSMMNNCDWAMDKYGIWIPLVSYGASYPWMHCLHPSLASIASLLR